MAGAVRFGPHQGEDPVGQVRAGSPHLLAADNEIAVGCPGGLGPQGKHVAAGFGFTVSAGVAPRRIEDVWDMFGRKFFGAEGGQHPADRLGLFQPVGGQSGRVQFLVRDEPVGLRCGPPQRLGPTQPDDVLANQPRVEVARRLTVAFQFGHLCPGMANMSSALNSSM